MSLQDAIKQAHEIRASLAEFEDETLTHDMLEGETDIFGFLDWSVKKYAEEGSQIEAIKNLIDTYKQRVAAIENRQDRFKDISMICLRAAGEKSYRSPYGTVSIRAVAPKPIVTDETKIPEDYFKVKKEIDKTLINQVVKDGYDIPGVSMSNGGETVSIRLK